jgi:hypothetical protein
LECPNCGGKMVPDQQVALRWVCKSCYSKYDVRLIDDGNTLFKYTGVKEKVSKKRAGIFV